MNEPFAIIGSLFIAIGILARCGNNKKPSSSESNGNLSVQSVAFQKGTMIPVAYTCDGPNVSPRRGDS